MNFPPFQKTNFFYLSYASESRVFSLNYFPCIIQNRGRHFFVILCSVTAARHNRTGAGLGGPSGYSGPFFGLVGQTPLFWYPEKSNFPRTTRFRFKPSAWRTVSYGGRCDSAHGGAPLRCLSAPRLVKIWGFPRQRAHARVFCACRRL